MTYTRIKKHSKKALVTYNLVETKEDLVIEVGGVRTRGILTTLTVIASGVRVVYATSLLSIMGTSFSVAGIFMNKNSHMKPVMSQLGFIATGASMVPWHIVARNAANGARAVGFELRSHLQRIPILVRPVQIRRFQ